MGIGNSLVGDPSDGSYFHGDGLPMAQAEMRNGGSVGKPCPKRKSRGGGSQDGGWVAAVDAVRLSRTFVCV